MRRPSNEQLLAREAGGFSAPLGKSPHSHVSLVPAFCDCRVLDPGSRRAHVNEDTDVAVNSRKDRQMNPTLAILIPKCCCKQEPCCCQDDCSCCKK